MIFIGIGYGVDAIQIEYHYHVALTAYTIKIGELLEVSCARSNFQITVMHGHWKSTATDIWITNAVIILVHG